MEAVFRERESCKFTTKAMVGSLSRGTLRWSYEECEPHARIRYEVNLLNPAAAWVRLTYTVNGTPMDYRVRLMTTQPTYGGRRYWFLCPLGRSDDGPPRRVAKLYLPPGGKYFGSRQAHGLTYISCQESGKYDGLYRRLAAKMGADVATIRSALRHL
jgi:hypothetical protein